MKKSIKMLEEKKAELLKYLNNPKAELGWEEVLLCVKKLMEINEALGYLTRNY